MLNHRLKRYVVRWDSRGLVYLAAPEDSVLLSTLLMMPDIHPNPGPQDGQQENWLVDGIDLTTAHRDSSNGGADTNLFRFIVSTKVRVETSSPRTEYFETAGNFEVQRAKQG